MNTKQPKKNQSFDTIEEPRLTHALNELGRSINLVSTYGLDHPAAKQASIQCLAAMNELFTDRAKLTIGAYNGVITIDERTVTTHGALQKSLERRLVRLRITGLKITRGTSQNELMRLIELLAMADADGFHQTLQSSGMEHIQPDETQYEAVREGQTVANESDLAGMGGDGVLVLDDGSDGQGDSASSQPSVHVEQIVAFLKGDIDADTGDVGEELEKLASDPDELGRMIMESVSIRQSLSNVNGESLNDIILGCLRRSFDGLRKQSAFQASEGKAELKKALLLLEESLLSKMRSLTGQEDPELDRQIVQAMREMDENLNFDIAATQYMEHREAIDKNKEQLQSFIRSQGADAAEDLLKDTGFPGNDWRKIVVESGIQTGGGGNPLSEGLSTLTSVFEKLEQLMKSESTDGSTVKDLLGQANENLDDTLDNTREKLEALSSTIGGQALNMSRSELLTSLAEVAQELMQPLTAINASVEMMLQGYVGSISDEQRNLLELAANSGEHLKFLMDMLITIVGCPVNKGVDDRFHTTSEQVKLMKDAEGQEHLPLNFR